MNVNFKRNGNYVGNRYNDVLTTTIKGVTFEVHQYPKDDAVSYEPNILIKNFDSLNTNTKKGIESRASELGLRLTKQGNGNRNIKPFAGQKVTCPGELADRVGRLVRIVNLFSK
jgi:hypothetical protein